MPVVRPSKLARFVCAALVLTACSSTDGPGTVRVFAAASLTEAFAELEANFEEANPGVNVELNLGGSSSLREQIRAGAPADVFASANEQIADALAGEGLLASAPTVFATNSLVVALPPGNPGGLESLEDLEEEGLLIGLCAAAVPCGELAIDTLAAAGVNASIDTNEPDVRALLTKIELGELDAGLVYRTDVLASRSGVESLPVDADSSLVTSYPVVELKDAPNPEGAAAFVDFVLSEASLEVLENLGFGAPQ